MQLENIGKLVAAVDNWVDWEGSLLAVADALDEPLDRLRQLFLSCGVCDVADQVKPGVKSYQALAVITLYYAMRQRKSFSYRAYRPKLQPVKLPGRTLLKSPQASPNQNLKGVRC